MEILTPEILTNLFRRMNIRKEYDATIIIGKIHLLNELTKELLKSRDDIGITRVESFSHMEDWNQVHFEYYFLNNTINVINIGNNDEFIWKLCNSSQEILVDDETTLRKVENIFNCFNEFDKSSDLDEFLEKFNIIR